MLKIYDFYSMNTPKESENKHTPLAILQSVWGYPNFKGIQEEIINHLINNKNAFVTLPTGGGKSICYQIPALCKTGTTLVISPLVALMKDQVQQLKKRGVKAVEISGGISKTEITEIIDNCQYGHFQLLYLSPERLSSEWMQNLLKRVPVSLIVLDEAHCISQWGHDFRPAYLNVSQLITLFPKVPVAAFTATATTAVQQDILLVLNLTDVRFFTDSFERKNIAYSVFKTDDKLHYVQKILSKNTLSSIIYLRNRKKCAEWSQHLTQLGFKSTYYHAGFSSSEKTENMRLWMQDEAQVMVATNAFGMGIDKASVQSIIHLDFPENIEDYYQESGRAGRNGAPAHAVILYSDFDLTKAEKLVPEQLPDKKFLLEFYKKLCSYLQIPYGEGENQVFDFKMEAFCKKYDFHLLKAVNSLQFLDRQHLIELSPDFAAKTQLQILISPQEMMNLIQKYSGKTTEVLLSMIRNYAGLYEALTPINLYKIGQKSATNTPQVHQILQELHNQQIVNYLPESADIRFRMVNIREDEYTINRIAPYLESQNKLKIQRINDFVAYVKDEKTCRNQLLLRYFGQDKKEKCGICSNCLKQQNQGLHTTEKIIGLLQQGALSSKDISLLLDEKETIIIQAIQELLQQEKISLNQANKYYLVA